MTSQMLAKYRVIFLNSAGQRKTRYPSTTRKVARILRALDTVEVDLRVVYVRDGKELGENSGHYTNREEWLTAWGAFAEPELLAWMSAMGERSR